MTLHRSKRVALAFAIVALAVAGGAEASTANVVIPNSYLTTFQKGMSPGWKCGWGPAFVASLRHKTINCLSPSGTRAITLVLPTACAAVITRWAFARGEFVEISETRGRIC